MQTMYKHQKKIMIPKMDKKLKIIKKNLFFKKMRKKFNKYKDEKYEKQKKKKQFYILNQPVIWDHELIRLSNLRMLER